MFFSSKSETHALTLLKQDHRLVEDLFRQWEEAEDNATAASIVSRICQALSVHAAVEETLLYPPALNALSDEDADLVREATVEHGALKGLIAVIDGSRPSESMRRCAAPSGRGQPSNSRWRRVLRRRAGAGTENPR